MRSNLMTWLEHTEFAVDPPNEFVDHRAQVLVLLYVLSAWHSDLNKHNFALPLGMLR